MNATPCIKLKKKELFCKSKASIQFLSEKPHAFSFLSSDTARALLQETKFEILIESLFTYLAYKVALIYTYGVQIFCSFTLALSEKFS